jgi:hypothetical protein
MKKSFFKKNNSFKKTKLECGYIRTLILLLELKNKLINFTLDKVPFIKSTFYHKNRSIRRKTNLVCGYTIIYLLVIISVFMIVIYSITESFAIRLKVINSSIAREQSLQIAEAGVNYYAWHLAHFPNDYKDGTGNFGPYIHDYTDFDTQNVLGRFSLEITPPTTGSTIITIKSTGYTLNYPNIKRVVTIKYGIPSLAKYSILNNGPVWIYYSPSIFSGQVHSNNGVRFDVAGNAPIYSTKSTYTCPSWQKCPSGTMPGIWGSGNSSFWQFPVPAIDFSAFTSTLSDIKNLSQSGGIYLPPSNMQGYSLVFNIDGTVTIYKVKSLISNPSGGTYDVDMSWISKNQSTDYKNRNLQYQVTIPSNGIIYVEDNVWIEGVVNGRVTVAAATLPYNPGTAPTIYIPNNIIYKDKDGTDVLGIIGQRDIIPTYHAPNNLEIDAAVISQNASFQFFYYPGNIKNNLIIYGSIIEFGWWFDNFVWTSGISTDVLSGYANSQYTYDSNLLYGPPPSFPLSSSGYEQINWSSN